MGKLANFFGLKKVPEETLKQRRKIGKPFLIVASLILFSWIILGILNFDLEPYGDFIGLLVFLEIIILMLLGIPAMLKIEKTWNQEEKNLRKVYGYGGYTSAFAISIISFIMGFVVRTQNQTGSNIIFVIALITFLIGLYQFRNVKKNKA